MTPAQKKKCHAIIHSHAVAAGAGNAIPVPGLGVAVDLVTMTTMAMSLCAVFGGNISKEAAKTLAIATMKNTMLRQPIRVLAKELSKIVPGLGQLVAPSITVVMLETAGWVLAGELEQKFLVTSANSKLPASKRVGPPKVAVKKRKVAPNNSFKPKPLRGSA